MIHGCDEFRALLEASLAGRPAVERLSQLAWHEHLFGCGDCRELLQAEEALEALLASLPEPRLTPEVSARVVARLVSERALDRLLALDAVPAPADLAAKVRARAHHEELQRQLDRLLALDEVHAPAGLAQRTVAGVRNARRARPAAARWIVPLAAAAALALIAWAVWRDRRASEPPKIVIEPAAPKSPGDRPDAEPSTPVEFARDPSETPGVAAPNAAEPEAELLAALDVLESWDLLMNEDVDLLLASLPAGYEAVIDDLEEGG